MEFNILLMKRYILPLLFCATQLNAQPVLVKDIRPGYNGSSPYAPIDFNGRVVFGADDGSRGNELWWANGTQADIVADLYPGNDSSISPTGMESKCVANEVLYFAADDGVTGTELYAWDGITPPHLVVDLNSTSTTGSKPKGMSAANGKVYFTATDDLSQDHLYVYDPANNTTEKVVDNNNSFFASDGLMRNMVSINNMLYFLGYYNGFPNNGREVFKYDPLTKTLTRNGDGSYSNDISSFTGLDDYVYYVKSSYTISGELWGWDGIHQPVKLSRELTHVSKPAVYNGKVYFSAQYLSNPIAQLYSYNPADNKINLVQTPIDCRGEVYGMTAYAGKLFFTLQYDLWSYDGINTAVKIKQPPKELTYYDIQFGLCTAGNILYLTAFTGGPSEELYAYYEAPTSVNTVTQQTPISIYPNPTTSSWNFDLSSFNQNNLQLIITDVTGRVVSKQQVNNDKKISATAPVPGTYLYYVTDDAGTAIQSGKLQKL
jgi:ELWxxDGT repeat protein